MICEVCGKEHDGSYGTGRFCSKHCISVLAGRSVKNRANDNFKKYNETRKSQNSKRSIWKCSACGRMFGTRQLMQEHRKVNHPELKGVAWNRGLTEETSEKVREIAVKVREGYRTGRLITKKGRHHTEETKELLSKKRLEYLDKSGGFESVKWYKIKNINGVEQTVRGMWELNIATKLNEKNILWERNHVLKYSLDDSTTHRYVPDFYLPSMSAFIEVKGYFSDFDKIKMDAVLKYNEGIKLFFISDYWYKEVMNGNSDVINDEMVFKGSKSVIVAKHRKRNTQ